MRHVEYKTKAEYELFIENSKELPLTPRDSMKLFEDCRKNVISRDTKIMKAENYVSEKFGILTSYLTDS